MGREISLIFILKILYFFLIDKFCTANNIEEVLNEEQDWRGGVNGLWPGDGITKRWNWKSITLLACSIADLILIIPSFLFLFFFFFFFPLNKDFSNLIIEMKNWMGFALSFCSLIFILVMKLKNLPLSNFLVNCRQAQSQETKQLRENEIVVPN